MAARRAASSRQRFLAKWASRLPLAFSRHLGQAAARQTASPNGGARWSFCLDIPSHRINGIRTLTRFSVPLRLKPLLREYGKKSGGSL